ncbi:Uma2 family endonuclease [Gloeothece verrucosa]|uniref:Putative restriction endonuclease domain-containing protein n=1 Tax=Gloeothece verrucosa (strain PCC 7822) TaxID=497965 RepID=E0UCH5_GLOV7|nr:Uma2 family endonuclease [Gloeothece verrucosa]ADN14046.1 protein of unknown function DUF820 [Gloeothece verrucosa PCC 7822]
MIAISDRQYMTPEEYLQWEEQQEIKYEYLDGEVYAMTGGTLPHNDLALNLASILKNHVRGRGCKVQISDGKVKVSEAGPFFYPDVVVSCDERDKTAIKHLQYPSVIAEVLSPSTERFDRGKKFRSYRRLSSLKEYVLISTEQKMIEVFRLNEKGLWELETYGEEDELQLTSINFSCPIALVYEDVILEPESDEI